MEQQEEIRKGPWTEQEDFQLVCFVGLFGDRRWDFIAKVSGLKVAGENNRTGKSCRLRWVNYLHPGLKRGKMTPQEERLVLELHAKWGNRWSRIARKLPGRTDNEIKNYWRTHMRKKAQEKKRAASPSSSSSKSSSSSSNITAVDSVPSTETGVLSFYDTGGKEASAASKGKVEEKKEEDRGYSMDDIWKEISLPEVNNIESVLYDGYGYGKQGCNFSRPSLESPSWEYCLDSLWKMDDEESKIFFPTTDQFLSCYEYGGESILTG